ncbi:MAG TPA: MFS transporter [Trebonia sp.]|jgi:EmrB/QacA subfamily drug resistance transporter|nr:MFS transporter [Trebonia sp.]
MTLHSQDSHATARYTPAHAVPPPDHRRWWSLLVVCLGVMMAFVNVSSTISALTAIQASLHPDPSTLVWITSAYSLVVVSLVMSAGTLADLIGRRRVFTGGAAVFAAASVLAFAAHGPGLLIVAQALMGAGGAAVLPSSLSIVSHGFTDPHERTSAISIWAACSGLGLAVGPLLSGLLLDHFSWNSVYLINVVIGVLAVVLSPPLVTESRHPSRRLDVPGMLLGTIVIAAGTYAIIEGASAGYTAGQIIAMYAVAALGLAAFVLAENRSPDPMLDLRLFRSRPFSAVMGLATGIMFGFVGIALISVLYMEDARHLDALATGVRLMVMFVSYMAVSSVAARIVRRVGFTVMLTSGLLLMGAGALALLATGPFDGFTSMWPGLLLAGVGSGLLVAPSTAASVNSVPRLQAGMASAAVNMFRQLGSVLGPAVLGTIVTTRFPRNLTSRLVSAHVPPATAHQITAAAVRGATGASLPAPLTRTVAASAAAAFTDATHFGLLVGGIVLLVMAIPVAAFVRHAPARSPEK